MPEYVRTPGGALVPKDYATPVRSGPPNVGPSEFLRPLCEQWLRRIDLAIEAKQPFQAIATQCDAFFAKASGFMWKSDYIKKYLGGGISPPTWQVTLNKAFELVALVGPYLFWQYPQVYIRSYDQWTLDPGLLGDPEDPRVQQMVQAIMSERESESRVQQLRNGLMELYLNYSQREQPGGGVAHHAEMAIIEALVKGRGVLSVESYRYPGSGRTLTMRRYRSVDDLLIDPDSRDPLLAEAKFIVLIHTQPDWEVEELFDLPRGYLRHRGALETKESLAANNSAAAHQARTNGKANDLVTWYEIWSKGGIGSRMSFTDDPTRSMISPSLHDAMDDVIGRYAYLCICPNVPFPLNAPSWRFRDPQTNEPIATDQDVREMFQWRCAGYGELFPCYADDRWPLCFLDFYKIYGSCWPIAPLGPAIGELTVLNVLISAFIEDSYESRKQIIAYIGSMAKDIEATLASTKNPALLKINDGIVKSVTDAIAFIKRPEINKSPLEAIAFVSDMFDKRSGLTEIHYAMTRTQSRSARDAAVKEEKASIRPEKMSRDVAAWLTESVELEKFLAGWTIEGRNLAPLLGRYGSAFWDQLIVNQDPEVVLREMKATVEANDIRKPNKDRLLANLQQTMQFLIPMMQQYAMDTGDVDPINEYMSNLNRAMEDQIAPSFHQWRPEPDPQQQQAQEQAMQIESAKQQAELAAKQLDVQAKQLELENAGREMGGDDRVEQLRFNFLEHQQEMEQDEEKHEQEMEQDRRSFIQDLLQKQAEGKQRIEQMRAEAQAKGNGRS